MSGLDVDVRGAWAPAAVSALALGAALALPASALAAPPGNDECGGAVAISAGLVAYDSTEATTSLSPAPCGMISRDLWYSFTAPADGTLSVTNCGQSPAGFDTVIAIYAGEACGELSQLVCTDSGGLCGYDEAFASVAVVAGAPYLVRFGSFGGASGEVGELLVSFERPPANDRCDAATALELDAPLSGSTIGAANDYQVAGSFAGVGQALPGGAAGRDVVYSFAAPFDGTYSFRVRNYSAGNAVLYLVDDCPAGPAPQVAAALAGANRTGTGTYASEEIPCVAMGAGEQVFVVVDETTPSGSAFRIEVTACAAESEPNGTPASADAFAPGAEGSIAPAGDVDMLSLGVLPAGSRVFAIVDGIAGNSSDFDLRVTTVSDTLEYDDANNDAPFGALAPNVAGTPSPVEDAEVFLRVSHFNAAIQAEPWRLHAVVRPPLAAAAAESEPNNDPEDASHDPSGYFLGATSSASDVDFFEFTASAGQLLCIGLDGDPLRNGTPVNPALALLDASGLILMAVNDTSSVSSAASGAGTLSATVPSSPGESILYRVADTGAYFVRVSAASAGDYLLSISASPTTELSYCPADASGCGGEGAGYLSAVAIGAIENSSGAEQGCYSSYAALPPAVLPRTAGAAIGVVNGAPVEDDVCTVWCDWNQDGDFDDLGEAYALSGGPARFSGSIVPPADALYGATTMRVRLSNAVADPFAGPCGGASAGEVEDYSVLVAPAPLVPPNDACVEALVIGNGTFGGTTVNATGDGGASCDPGGGASRDVWFAYVAGSDGVLSIETCGSAIDTALSVHDACGGAELACSDDCGGGPCAGPSSCLSLLVAGGQSLRIRVSDKGAGEGGAFVLTTDLALVNDLCSGAVLVECPGSAVGTTIGSTLDVGLPDCTAVSPSPPNNGGNVGYTAGGVWYRLIGTGETVSADTLSASYDTRLHVFAGSCDTLVCVTANDDIGPTFRSKVSFQTSLGADYFILVSGFGPATGGFTLNLSSEPTPSNDDCADAIALSVSGTLGGTLAGATGEGFAGVSTLLAPCATNIANPLFDVWYSWTAPCSAEATVATCGAIDTLLSVHALCPSFALGNFVAGACSDNGGPGCSPGSRVTFAATSGSTYLFRVAGAAGAQPGGEFMLTWSIPDADEDGTPDCLDGCPADPAKTAPGACGCGVSDRDGDRDGTPDCLDACPQDPAKILPGICGCGVSDLDSDLDGVADCNDGCPLDPTKIDPGVCGCGVSDVDGDRDGVSDCDDGCPLDPLKVAPGACGCGVSDVDSDLDGVADCNDACPLDPSKVDPGLCGCGVSDVDSDLDGVVDCDDDCPTDPAKTAPGLCGCGVADDDGDGDGAVDCVDLCPTDPTKTDPGVCGCGEPDIDGDGDGVLDCDDECPGFDDALDCNENGVPDGCDLLSGGSQDLNGTGVPDECECLADLSDDGVVDGSDLGLVLAAWGTIGPSSADLNFDHAVDGADLGALLAAWGPCLY